MAKRDMPACEPMRPAALIPNRRLKASIARGLVLSNACCPEPLSTPNGRVHMWTDEGQKCQHLSLCCIGQAGNVPSYSMAFPREELHEGVHQSVLAG
eukprot:6359108-Alexandrium_andersonii.AAC.1